MIFFQLLYMTFYLHIGVLGAAAPNKPTAKPVGKKVYLFCTCDNQATAFCKHNSCNVVTPCL